MLQIIKNEVKMSIEKVFQEKYSISLDIIIGQPKAPEHGDFAVPIFNIVKMLSQPLALVAQEVSEILLTIPCIERTNPIGGFINFFLKRQEVGLRILNNALDCGDDFGSHDFGVGKTVVIDYSSPNIAKSFTVGHLRSTMIGNSLKLINQKCGYKTEGINYLGDWGTQFGKMVVAYKRFGNLDAIKAHPIAELSRLYVLFHEKAKIDPTLDDDAREAFRKMESGDKEYLSLWKWIREESLLESEEIYRLLKVSFDAYDGESFYNDKMIAVIDLLKEKQLLETDQGAGIVRLGDDIPPALIEKKGGGSLYITRDIAAAMYRMGKYHASKLLYVTGGEQKLHFEQLKRVIKRMGYEWSDYIEHVHFGLVLKNGKKMSTREGGGVKLADVLRIAIDLAKKQILAKNHEIADVDELARKIGVGAIIFSDLKNFHTLDYEFDLDKMVKFEGQTGPYIQYTAVRINSIINGVDITNEFDIKQLEGAHYFDLLKVVDDFPAVVKRACVDNAPSYIAKYLIGMAQAFNRFYATERIICEDVRIMNTNIAVAKIVLNILREGLRLLGIEYVEKM